MRSQDPRPDSTTRRKIIASGLTVSAGFLAGCPDGSEGGDSGETDGGDSDGSDGGGSQTEADGGGESMGGSVDSAQYVVRPHNNDPLRTLRTADFEVVNRVFEGLYEYDDGVGITSKLATGDPEVANDGARYIVSIEEDARFHNGDPVTAEDVAYTFTAPVEEGTARQGEFSMIDSVETIDETTVQFDLEEPYAPFQTITMTMQVVNKSVREDDPEGYNSNPVGSGPFRFVEDVEGEYTELERWDDYWDEDVGPANLSDVRFVPYSDDSARTSALLAGDVDIVDIVPSPDYSTIDNDSNLRISDAVDIGPTYIAYNCNDGPTANPDVRAGIEHAFTFDAYIEQELGPTAEAAVAPMAGPMLESWDLPADEYGDMINEYDPERAADLLSGNVPDGWQPPLVCLNRGPYITFLERVATRLSQLEGVNINPQVTPLEVAEFDATVHTGEADDHQLTHIGFAPNGPDWDAAFWEMHESREGETDKILYRNPEFHEKIVQARQSSDRDRRRDLYDDLIRLLREDTVRTPGYVSANTMGMQNHVQDLQTHSMSGLNPRLLTPYNNTYVES